MTVLCYHSVTCGWERLAAGQVRFRIKTSRAFPALRSVPGYLPVTAAAKRALARLRR